MPLAIMSYKCLNMTYLNIILLSQSTNCEFCPPFHSSLTNFHGSRRSRLGAVANPLQFTPSCELPHHELHAAPQKLTVEIQAHLDQHPVGNKRQRPSHRKLGEKRKQPPPARKEARKKISH